MRLFQKVEITHTIVLCHTYHLLFVCKLLVMELETCFLPMEEDWPMADTRSGDFEGSLSLELDLDLTADRLPPSLPAPPVTRQHQYIYITMALPYFN